MNVQFTKFDVTHCGGRRTDLGMAYRSIYADIHRVAVKFEKRQDDRTLIVVMLCPCCCDHPLLEEKNAVFVSPFAGIDSSRITTVDLYPPWVTAEFKRSGYAKNEEEFLDHFRETIQRALEE